MAEASPEFARRAESDLLGTLQPLGWRGRLWIGTLVAVGLWGVGAYVIQCRYGLGVTAMRDYVSWGLYIATFVFYIGISHVGALLSAILRLTGAEWRRPVTRMAEAITFSSLIFAGIMPVIDMGRPDRTHFLVIYGRLQSPILWDIICVATYFTGSLLFLYVPMIPDIALLRDRQTNAPAWRRAMYRFLALDFHGTAGQRERIDRSLRVLTAIILPVAVSVHTVVSWIFAMTLRPGWNSTIFGPYFVAGALMSGCASVIVAMAAFRSAYRLEAYVTPVHFRKLGLLLFVLALVYLYFNVNEYWTMAYKMEASEEPLLSDLFHGAWAPLYWGTQILGLVIPLLILAFPAARASVPVLVGSSLFIVAGAWVKRYVIVVPTLIHPYLPIQDAPAGKSLYFPSLVEWSVTAGTFAGFLLVYTAFSRLFPIVSISETVEGVAESGEERVGLVPALRAALQ